MKLYKIKFINALLLRHKIKKLLKHNRIEIELIIFFCFKILYFEYH